MFARLKCLLSRVIALLKARIPEPWWRRIVNMARLLLLLGGIAMVGLAIGMYFLAKGVYAIYKKAPPVLTEFGVDGTVSATLPDPVRFSVNRINMNLPKTMHVEVPVDQVFAIPINERFDVPVDTTVEVPFDQHVYVETTFPLNVEVPLDGLVAQTRVLGVTATVPLKGKFPLQMNVPFKGVVHIKTQMKVPFKQTLSVPMKRTFRVPIKMNFAIDLPVRELFGSLLKGPFEAEGNVIGEILPEVRVKAYLQKDGRLLVQADQPASGGAKKDDAVDRKEPKPGPAPASSPTSGSVLPGQRNPAGSAQAPQDHEAATQQKDGGR